MTFDRRNSVTLSTVSWQETTITLPSHLLNKQSSQDIFLIAENNVVRLANSNHAGHQYFRCLAELKRNEFLNGEVKATDNTATNPTTISSRKEQQNEINKEQNRITMYMVSTICGNGGLAKIYVFSLESEEWKQLRNPREAETFVNKALQSYFFPQNQPRRGSSALTPLATTTNPQNERNGENLAAGKTSTSSSKKRHRASVLGAAETLLLVLHPDTGPTTPVDNKEDQTPRTVTPSRSRSPLPLKKRIRFNDENIPITPPFNYYNREVVPTKLEPTTRENTMNTQKQNATSAPEIILEAPRPIVPVGISMSEINTNDVLCGGSGEGVLWFPHYGNKLFHKLIDAKKKQFYSRGKDDKRHMLRVSQLVVKMMNDKKGSRFLAMDSKSGLWYEVKPEKSWSKAYRTFIAHTTTTQPADSTPNCSRHYHSCHQDGISNSSRPAMKRRINRCTKRRRASDSLVTY